MIVYLDEASRPIDVVMPREVALALADNKIATVLPTTDDDVWRVTAVQRVGVARLAGHEERITSKLPIVRLFFLLGYAHGRRVWRDEDVDLDTDHDVLAAVARAFIRQLGAAVSKGLLQGYRSVRESAPVVRGRIDFNEQLKRRTGIPAPIEIRYDELTIDIDENRMFVTAINRLLRLTQLDHESRRLLKRLETMFLGVALVPRGIPARAVHFDRRNEHYRPAYELAALIVRDSSLEHRHGNVVASGFLVNVAELFEDFVSAAMKEALEIHGGVVAAQLRSHLDASTRLAIRPDIAWSRHQNVVAIMDAKYKAEKPSGYPHADVYQMLAYCTRFGLSDGHLIYAAGEEEPTVHEIVGSTVRVHCHALNLDRSQQDVLRRVSALAAEIARTQSASVMVPQAF